MTIREYFSFIVDEIHSTVIATVDDNGLPVTCAIDIMDFDERRVTSNLRLKNNNETAGPREIRDLLLFVLSQRNISFGSLSAAVSREAVRRRR